MLDRMQPSYISFSCILFWKNFTGDKMSDELNKLGMDAMKAEQWNESIHFFSESLLSDPNQAHVHLMLGQSYRFAEEYSKAVEHLTQAVSINNQDAGWFSALGIALQLDNRLEESVEAFRKANTLDPYYSTAYNSAAISFRKMGNFKKAKEVYDLGINALITDFLMRYPNEKSQEIYIETFRSSELFMQFAMDAAIKFAARSNLEKVSFPKPEAFLSEVRSNQYGGLMWVDNLESEVGAIRMYLPNYFATLSAHLCSSPTYYMMVENKARDLFELDELEDARAHENEALIYKDWYHKIKQD